MTAVHGKAVPVQDSAFGKHIDEAFILAVCSGQLVHEVHGHAHKLNGETNPAPHSCMENSQADGDASPLGQHKGQQGVGGVIVGLGVTLHTGTDKHRCMENTQADGDALPSKQHKGQQGVGGVIAGLRVTLHTGTDEHRCLKEW